MLWWLLCFTIPMFLGFQLMSPSNLFPWKCLAISFEWGCYDSKLLKYIKSHLQKSVNQGSELISHQMYSKGMRQFSNGILISISSESSKIYLLMKNLHRSIWFNLCRQYFFVLCSEYLLMLLAALQLYNVLVLRFLDIKYFSFANVSYLCKGSLTYRIIPQFVSKWH